MKKLLIPLIVAMTGCTSVPEKSLILYYSQTGTTGALAAELQRQTGADMVRFDVKETYSGSFEQTIERCEAEQEMGFLPAIEPLPVDISKYDVIFLCYPIWFGTFATPVKSLYREYDLTGKIIVPLCTFGSGGSISSRDALRTAMPYTDIRYPFGIRESRIDRVAEELHRFLVDGGYVRGEKASLPDFEVHEDFSYDDAEIFHRACDGYQYPIGEPVGASSRVTPWGTEYVFAANGFSPSGDISSCTVRVLVEDGKEPVFTEVIR